MMRKRNLSMIFAASVLAFLSEACTSNGNDSSAASVLNSEPEVRKDASAVVCQDVAEAPEVVVPKEEVTPPDIEDESDYSHIETKPEWDYYIYSNGHFGRFSLKIPKTFHRDPIAELDDGRGFSMDDGSTIVVSSYNNILDEESTYERFCRSVCDGKEDTYTCFRDNWVVRSGSFVDGSVYYIKYVWTQDVIYTLYFAYPKNRQTDFDKIIPFVAESWHVM